MNFIKVNFPVIRTTLKQDATIGENWMKGVWNLSVLFLITVWKSIIIFLKVEKKNRIAFQ